MLLSMHLTLPGMLRKRQSLVIAGAVLSLLGAAEVRAQEAAAPAEEAGTRAEEARARVGLGIGGLSVVVRGKYSGVFAASAWVALPLGRHFQLTPAFTLYSVAAYGSDHPGLKNDVSLSLEYVFAGQRFRFVPGLLFSLTRRGVLLGRLLGAGPGVSLALQVPINGPLELFARSEHRIVVTPEDGYLVNQVVFGPALGF
jgi:hypothetical protein